MEWMTGLVWLLSLTCFYMLLLQLHHYLPLSCFRGKPNTAGIRGINQLHLCIFADFCADVWEKRIMYVDCWLILEKRNVRDLIGNEIFCS